MSAPALEAGRTNVSRHALAGRLAAPLGLVVLVCACLFGLRFSSPAEWLDNDQERPAAYVLDVVQNGSWLCQHDWRGDVTSKPPLHTWLCALVATLCGRINRLSLHLPGALGALGTACLILAGGRASFGTRAALFGALAFLLTPAGLKQFGLARTDGVFCFLVALAAFLGYRAWLRGSGWTWFWLAAAAATLTKGPLGLLLAAGGLFARTWERRSGATLSLRGSHLPGVLLFSLLTGGWLLLSYWLYGRPVIEKLIGAELVGNALRNGDHDLPGTLFWKPSLYYLGRAAPWSLFAVWGLWRTWKNPAGEPGERRLERFLFCWFVVGLFLFSLTPHQRTDLIWPLMPAGALLAGRELARSTGAWTAGQLRLRVSATVVLAFAAGTVYLFHFHARGSLVRKTAALERLAAEIERRGGPEFPVTHVDTPMSLQLYLNTLRPHVSPERAARLLRGPEPAFVAVEDLERLEAVRTADDPPWYVVLPVAPGPSDGPTRIVGNRPELVTGDDCAFCVGSLCVRAQGARLLRASERELRFDSSSSGGAIVLANESAQPRLVRVRVLGHAAPISGEYRLAAGETRALPVTPRG
jgi:4-amino-4-deoxy-L-arabinose transferase-like glycosyltransferase